MRYVSIDPISIKNWESLIGQNFRTWLVDMTIYIIVKYSS